ncbi:hypothetical protein AMECASPLE_032281, partial [Ameca splendens]
MDDFVRKILNDWGLNEWIGTFEDGGINMENLYCLEDQDIEKLISKVGPRALFRKQLKLLKEQQNTNDSDTKDIVPFSKQVQKNTTAQAELLPSKCERGKRKLDQEETNKGQPRAKQCRRSMS